MKSVLISSIFDNQIMVKTFNENFEVENFQEKTVLINNKLQKGVIKEISLNGIRILMQDLKTNDYSMQVYHNFPFFKLQFEIEGSSLYTPSNKLSREVYIPGGHYNLFYLPEVKGKLQYKTNYRKTLEILFTEDYIKKIIGSDFKNDLINFGEAIAIKKPFLLWNHSKPISEFLYGYINQIINCEYTGNIKKAFLEAKINELLIVLLAKTNTKELDLPKQDYLIILKVEDYIKNNLKNKLTISKLAAVAGLNTTKLKQNFKQVFGTTIFKYITQLRMEKAKRLVLEKNYSITQASYEVGYKNPQHFTKAFKKKYHYLPSSLKQNKW